MSKRAKKEVKMIDMSARMQVEVIPATEEEIMQLTYELNELTKKIQDTISSYEHNLSRIIENMMLEDLESDESENSSHFIRKYQDVLEKKNHEHIQEKLELYQSYLKNSFDK